MTGPSSSEREFASLLGELHALEEDIAAARAAAARARGGLDLRRRSDPLPSPHGERVRLRDGTEILIRPLEPQDAPAIELGLERLTAMSRYRRFRRRVTRLSPGQLEELTRVDHRSRESLGALDPVSGEGIGVARFVRDPHEPDQAEVTYVVADAWQHRGVGDALLDRRAARARAAGVERFTATTLAGDQAARRLLAHVAEPVQEHRDGGIVEVTARIRG